MTNETTQQAADSNGAWDYQSSATAPKRPAQVFPYYRKETEFYMYPSPIGVNTNDAAPVTA